MATLYVGNDMRLALQGRGRLEDENGNPVTGATVEATLYSLDQSTEVGGVTWPVALTEGSEDGEYFGILPAEAEVEAGKDYFLNIDVVAPGDAKAKWMQKVRAAYRRM